jgi:IS5 family transposase
MAKPRDNRQMDLLRPAPEDIIDLGHPLVRLAREIDWPFLDSRFGSVCSSGPGQPPLPTPLVARLFILKHMRDPSDDVLCARWLENPYYQFFCGEVSFCHKLPFDRSSLTHWRQRLGEKHLVALVQESLAMAHKTGALATRDLERVVVHTTVQPKAIAHPTDARYAIVRWRRWSILPGAMASRCGRAIGGWPSARRSWSARTALPISSSGRGANSNSCAPGWAG